MLQSLHFSKIAALKIIHSTLVSAKKSLVVMLQNRREEFRVCERINFDSFFLSRDFTSP